MTYKRYVGRLLAALVMGLGLAEGVQGKTEPNPPPPEVMTVQVTKHVNGTDGTIAWSDGVSPWAIVRSETANFSTSTTVTFVSRGTATSPINDPNVLTDTKLYFYQVKDDNAGLEVYGFPASSQGGTTLILDGVGFDAVPSDNELIFEDGTTATITSASSTQIQASIPAVPMSGTVIVTSNNGSVTREALNRIGTGWIDITHMNVDTNHHLYVCDRHPADANDGVYKVENITGTKTNFAPRINPVGLPKDSLGNFYIGVSTENTNNGGTIFQVPPAGGSTVWATTGQGANDPVYPRAIAIDPYSAVNNGFVFLLDGYTGRVRRAPISPGFVNKTWITGLVVPNNPGGMSFALVDRGSGLQPHLYLTEGGEIDHYAINQTTGAPTWVANNVFPGSNLGQITTDDDDKLWVADRTGNRIIRIDPRPAPNGKTLSKITGIPDVRAVALDTDSVTNKPVIYVATATNVYKFARLKKTARIKFHVLNEALRNPITLVAISTTDMDRIIDQDFKMARAIMRNCGVDVINDGIEYLSDPRPLGDGTVRTLNSCAGLDTEEATLISHADELVIHVYYITALVMEPVAGTRVPIFTAGFTWTNDCLTSMNNSAEAAIFIERFAGCWDGTGTPGCTPVYMLGAQTNTLAHELFHFLLDNYVGTYPPPPPSEHSGGTRDLLWPETGGGRVKISIPECDNVTTNSDEFEFIDPF